MRVARNRAQPDDEAGNLAHDDPIVHRLDPFGRTEGDRGAVAVDLDDIGSDLRLRREADKGESQDPIDRKRCQGRENPVLSFPQQIPPTDGKKPAGLRDPLFDRTARDRGLPVDGPDGTAFVRDLNIGGQRLSKTKEADRSGQRVGQLGRDFETSQA